MTDRITKIIERGQYSTGYLLAVELKQARAELKELRSQVFHTLEYQKGCVRYQRHGD